MKLKSYIKLLRPETLFFFGVIQALFPYSLWVIFEPNQNYNQDINGKPIILWLVGFMAFIVSASCTPTIKPETTHSYIVHKQRVRTLFHLVFAVWIILFGFVINSYGGIPILQFIVSSSSDINAVNETQATEIPGLFGLWFIINIILSLVLSLEIVATIPRNRISSMYVLLGTTAVLLGAILAGKRQGLIVSISIIAPAIIIALSHLNDPKTKKIILRKININLFIWLALFFVSFGAIGTIRSGGDAGGGSLRQMLSYLDFPLINMEWQIQEFGLFSGSGNFLPLISGIIPYKAIAGSEFGIDFSYIVFGFMYPEPGIGAGFFGPVHLSFGIYGVIAFSAIIGYFSRKIFNKAITDPRWGLPYCIFVWPLFSAHSYSHFISALFFLLPFIISIATSHYSYQKISNP